VRTNIAPVGQRPTRLSHRNLGELLDNAPKLTIAAAPEDDDLRFAALLGDGAGTRQALPTTDAYSAPCSQDEFFFRMPFETMDLLWYALESDVPVAKTAEAMDLNEAKVRRACSDLAGEERTTEYLRTLPIHYGR
jgi:hypothetical protein